MKIEILNPDEFKGLFESWGKFAATCYGSSDKYAERIGKSCLNTGHTSGSRSRFVEIKIEGISRSCIDQLARSEQGVVKNIQSQRYTKGDFEYYTDPLLESYSKSLEYYHNSMNVIKALKNEFEKIFKQEIELKESGLSGEKVNEITRNLYPMAIHSKGTFAFNIEALIRLCHTRLCTCAQREIRKLVELIRDECVKIIPELKDYLVPVCEHNLWCPESEKRSCGRFTTKNKLKEMIANEEV